MPDRNLVELFDRYLAGTATPAEIKTLMLWLDQPENETEARQLLETGWEKFHSTQDVFDEQTSARLLEKIQTSAPLQEEVRKPSGPLRSTGFFTAGRVAAAVILLSLGALYVATKMSSRKGFIPMMSTPDRPIAKDIPPGTDGAILTLADGRQIVLDSARNGELTRQGNTAIVKQGGQLAYTNNKGPQQPALYNTLLIPRGRQYQLVLPDGSHVWLNAASSVRYPAAFTGKERNVEITGEAYFEVAPDAAHPFRVKAGETEVDVLGTHFNIMAYEEENAVKTTLLEGAVKVIKAGTSNLLQPGQQAQSVKNTRGPAIVVVDDAPVDEVVAWKNGLFFFNRSNLQTVMRQIARWYDVEIVYEGEVPIMEFGGKISRNNNISEVLKILELSKVHFRIEDKKIIVMP
jgi:transmembrane sensor